MAEDNYKEIEKEEQSTVDEKEAISFADIIKPGDDSSKTLPLASGHSHESGSLSNLLSSTLPNLQIGEGKDKVVVPGSSSDSRPHSGAPAEGINSLQNILGRPGDNNGNSSPEPRENKEREQGVLRTLTDMLSNTIGEGINNSFRDKLTIQAKLSAAEVSKALSGLPEDLQKEYNKLEGAKGGYTDEQLAFIKKHAGMDAYNAARNYNDVSQTLRALDKLGEKKIPADLNQQPPTEAEIAAKKAYGQVKEALSQLPPKLQGQFDRLQGNKDGTYTNEQLGFIKRHAGIDAYNAANTFNDAVRQQYRERLNNGNNAAGQVRDAQPADGRNQQREAQPADRAAAAANGDQVRDAQPAERQREMQNRDEVRGKIKAEMMDAYGGVKKAVADLKPALQEQFHNLKGNKDGSYSQEQLKFLKDHTLEGYLGARRYNAANDQLNQVNQAEQRVNEANTLQARLGKIQDQVNQLPKALRYEFSQLPMNKDGVGYNQAHVDFLMKNVGKEAAFAMKTYINDAREAFWNRIKK